jgi:hypothetical protein
MVRAPSLLSVTPSFFVSKCIRLAQFTFLSQWSAGPIGFVCNIFKSSFKVRIPAAYPASITGKISLSSAGDHHARGADALRVSSVRTERH